MTVRAHCLLPWYFAFIAKLLKLIHFNNVLRFKNLTLKGQPWPDFMSQPKSVWFVTVMISTTSNKIQKRFAKCKTSTVLENKHFFSIWAELWGQTFFPPLFKICSGELTLAKDIATNTIWHAELRHGGKLMKGIENAKGIVYVLNKTHKKMKTQQSIGYIHSKLINGNFLFIEFKTPLQMVLGQLAMTNENLSK